MIALLRFLGLRGVIAVLAVAVAFALMVRVDWITRDRDAAVAEVVEQVRVNAMLSAQLATARNDLNVVNSVLSGERDRAIAAERRASELRERIRKDAGTDRDGEVAPVLRDTIEQLHRTRTRADALFLGRMEAVHQLVVVVDGELFDRREVRGFKACRDLAAAAAVDLAKRPELVANVRRVSIRCDAVVYGDRT